MSDDSIPEPEEAPVQKPKKLKRLTRKQAKLARARAKDPDASLNELGARTGYTSRTHVHRALKTEHVQDRIRRLMDANPALTDEALTKKLAEGLKATVTKIASHDGIITDKETFTDFSTRQRYLETAAEWKGIAEKRVRISSDDPPPLSAADALKILAAAQCPPIPDRPPRK